MKPIQNGFRPEANELAREGMAPFFSRSSTRKRPLILLFIFTGYRASFDEFLIYFGLIGFFELRLHRRISMSEFFYGDVLGFVVGEAELAVGGG